MHFNYLRIHFFENKLSVTKPIHFGATSHYYCILADSTTSTFVCTVRVCIICLLASRILYSSTWNVVKSILKSQLNISGLIHTATIICCKYKVEVYQIPPLNYNTAPNYTDTFCYFLQLSLKDKRYTTLLNSKFHKAGNELKSFH